MRYLAKIYNVYTPLTIRTAKDFVDQVLSLRPHIKVAAIDWSTTAYVNDRSKHFIVDQTMDSCDKR